MLTDPFVPVFLWALWAEVDIASAVMYGWWLEDSALGPAALPARATQHSDVIKVTTYALKTQAVIVVASFSAPGVDVSVALAINNTILNLPGDMAGYCLNAPRILPFQPVATKLGLNDTFVVPHGQGWIFQLQYCQ